MRASMIRRAQQASERFLTPYNPTGLAGLLTHPHPRSRLLKVYNETLINLSNFPKDSAYRTSVEAITKHRLSILENVKPEGYEAWSKRVEELQKQSRENPAIGLIPEGHGLVEDEREIEWDGTGADEGSDIQVDQRKPVFLGRKEGEAAQSDGSKVQLLEIPHEPPLTAQQVSELEEKFSAGLLEEVIEVAEGELQLVKVMQENKVWEELVEKAPEDQWGYFERVRHVKGTQAPPTK